MDMRYKKKDLPFTNSEISRMSRHAETLKARESSRFKRLSLLRNIEEEVDEEQPTKIVKREEKKKPQSRLEMLFKWKEEKIMKKKLDKKNDKKPFYVGSQLKQSNFKMSSSVPQPKGVSFSSRIASSRLVPPSSTQPAKILSTTKQVSSSSTQPAKTMNTTKQQTKGTTFQSSKIPNNFKPIGGKTANVTKSNSGLSKISKAVGNATVSSTTQGSLPRIAQSTKAQAPKSAPNTRSGVAKPLAVKSQVSALPKPTLAKQPNKPLSKTGIPSFPSNSLKGNSVQNIKNRKPVLTPVSKVHEKVTPHSTENVSNKKIENCLKTAFTKLPARKNEASNSTSKEKSEERNNAKEELIPQIHLDSASSIFDCDISIIKCSQSFAPANFNFVPPPGLPNFSIDDEVFERIKAKVSRTSTPSKELKKSSSPAVKVASNNSSLTNSVRDMSTNLLLEEILQEETTDANPPSGTENYLLNQQKNVPILVNESTDLLAKVDLKKIERLFEEHKKVEEEYTESNSGEIYSGCRTDNAQKVTINDLANDQKNIPILVNESTDFLAKVDLNKIDRLFEEYKKLEELGAESNSGNDLLNENKSAESAKALEDVSIDSPFSIVDLSDSEDICTKPLELLKLEDEPISDKGLNKKENNQSTNISEDVCADSPLQIIDLNKIKKISTNHELDILESEELIKDKVLNKKESNQKMAVTKDTHVDSPLKMIDLNKYEKIAANNELEVLEEEDLINVDDLFNQQDQDEYIKKKLAVHSKRSSMLKNVPILNSIAEDAEHEGCSSQTPNVYSKNKQTATPSRCSRRLQQFVTLEENSPSTSAETPRRSLRLQNNVAKKCDFEEPTPVTILSPKPKSSLRRSIRLIDLNTPEREIVNSPTSKTNITVDFQRLTLQEPENINPHACLLDFDCSPVPKAQPRKISLLYSPEKVRKSMRRSIRGDLMSFSPSN